MPTDRALLNTSLNERAQIGSHVRRVFLKALQTFFGQNEFEQLGYRWIENDPKTQIVIAAEYTQEQEIKEPQHQIIVNRGALNLQQVSIDNTNQRNPKWRATAPAKAGDEPVGNAHRWTLMVYTEMQVQIFSELPREAEVIAAIAAVPLLQFKRQIRKAANLHRIDNPTIGPETPIQSTDSKIFMSAVLITVPVAFPFSWKTTLDPQKLELAFNLITDDC